MRLFLDILLRFTIQNVCAGMMGFCLEGAVDCTAQNVVAEDALPEVAKFLLEIAAGLSVLFMVWGGILMLISMGDESSTTRAKWAIIYALIGLTGALLSQAFIGSVATIPLPPAGAVPTAADILGHAVQFLVNVVNILFFSVIIFSGIRMLVGHGQPEEFSRAKRVIEWAIIGAVIVNVARTLVRAVLSLFNV